MTGKEDLAIVFQTLFDEAQEVVAEVYESGVMEFMKERHRGRYEEILDRNEDIERLWLEMKQGKDTLEEFREALASWKLFCVQAVALYRDAAGE